MFVQYVLFHVLFGLIIGSFLNVLILRHNTGKTLLGRSGCLICRKELQPLELVPVLSWIALRGVCGGCKTRISIQYPLVEIATAVLFGLVAGADLSIVEHVLTLILMSLLVIIGTYDFRHTIIPDEWSYSFSALALLLSLMAFTPISIREWVESFIAGPIVASPLALLWFASGGRWMGLGDAKLTLGFGWLFGVATGLAGLVASFVVGAVISVIFLLGVPKLLSWLSSCGISHFGHMNTHFTMKSEVPFGPFLITTYLCIWFALLYDIPLNPIVDFLLLSYWL